jgi:hypothetical protein
MPSQQERTRFDVELWWRGEEGNGVRRQRSPDIRLVEALERMTGPSRHELWTREAIWRQKP